MDKLLKGDNNVIRSAVVETNNLLNKTSLRSTIERLYPLEIHTNIDTNENNNTEIEINRHNTTFTYDERSTRAAAESGTLIRCLAN